MAEKSHENQFRAANVFKIVNTRDRSVQHGCRCPFFNVLQRKPQQQPANLLNMQTQRQASFSHLLSVTCPPGACTGGLIKAAVGAFGPDRPVIRARLGNALSDRHYYTHRPSFPEFRSDRRSHAENADQFDRSVYNLDGGVFFKADGAYPIRGYVMLGGTRAWGIDYKGRFCCSDVCLLRGAVKPMDDSRVWFRLRQFLRRIGMLCESDARQNSTSFRGNRSLTTFLISTHFNVEAYLIFGGRHWFVAQPTYSVTSSAVQTTRDQPKINKYTAIL